MNIVFCTTCKNRAFHLAQTLPKNLAGNPKSRFIVLDYGSQDDLQEILKPYADNEQVIVYRYFTDKPFHMTHAKNMAHRLGILEGGEVLVNLDADNYIGVGFEDWVEEHFKPNSFLWAGFVKGQGRKLRGVSGRIACTPNAFRKAGGYDERYITWAPDDKDFNRRLVALGYKPIEIDRSFLEAIPHGDGLRFKEYPEVRREVEASGDIYLPPTNTHIANFGNIGCGDVFDLEGSRIELSPVPTRIFGIGLHKTATTSLHHAFKILGYDSAHWESGDWARRVWQEMRGTGMSPTLERSYASCDLPISVLYKELDKAYPGSKFILTVRDEVDWLRSVRDHFTPKNPHQWEWAVYPFTNKMHKAVYGRIDFDAKVFLERYRRHNAEVLEYFKNRPNDLLVMTKMEWPGLCKFLKRPVPQVPYPRKFVTKK